MQALPGLPVTGQLAGEGATQPDLVNDLRDTGRRPGCGEIRAIAVVQRTEFDQFFGVDVNEGFEDLIVWQTVIESRPDSAVLAIVRAFSHGARSLPEALLACSDFLHTNGQAITLEPWQRATSAACRYTIELIHFLASLAKWFSPLFVSIPVLSESSKRPAIALLLALLALTGCTSQNSAPAEHANHPAPVATDVEHCAYLLGTFMPVDQPGAVGREFSVAVWNAQKVTGSPWLPDFGWLTDNFDLVMIQEFALASDWQESGYLSFAPGFGARKAATGVATLSRVEPLSRCELDAREPMLRTSKATAIARFPMPGGESLVVVNLHAVNFALGLANFGGQLREAVQAVAGHDGPLIFSGDFNTWRADRVALMEQLLSDLELQPVQFATDERKKIFGRYLDHIYVRGLEVVDATTQVIDASDHNPMFVRLRL